MSGGIAYVYDAAHDFRNSRCNMEMVDFEAISGADEKELKQLIKNHFKYTSSELAYKILDNWEQSLLNFVKVMPTDYKNALERLKREQLTANETIA